MQTISITVANKRATVEGSPVLVCNNTGDEIVFTFDDEWKGLDPKVARFVYTCDGQVLHQDVAFTGDTVEIPLLSNISYVHVGVYAGELSTTTAAYIPCLPSVLCGSGAADGGVIFSPDYGKFKLWNDITLEEDVNSVGFSTKDDGSDIQIKELFLYFCGKFDSDAAIALWYDKGARYQCWQSIKQNLNNDNAFWIYSKRISDGLYISIYPNEQIVANINTNGQLQGLYTANKNLKCDISYLNSTKYKKSAKSWTFGGGSTYPNFKMLSGSRILVWGVQDDD